SLVEEKRCRSPIQRLRATAFWLCMQWAAIRWTRLSCRSFAANAVRLQLHANPSDARVSRTVVADEFAGEADQDRCQGGQPRPLRHVPDGRGRSATTDVQRNPHAHCPVAGATRTSVKGPRDQMRRARKAEARLDEDESAGFRPTSRQPIASAAHGTPVEGG